MEKVKNFSSENTIKFQGVDEFYLPKNCIICGIETENRIERTQLGSFTHRKEYKKDYRFKLPICKNCNANINLKAGKSGVILLLGILLGISLGILLYYLTYTILLSIAVFIVLVVFPYLSYRAKIKPRIKLNDFLQMKVIPNEEVVQFNFKNQQYANYVQKINQENLEEKEKKKAEKIEKAENIEKVIPKSPERKEELTSPADSSQVGDNVTNITKAPNKDVIELKIVNDVNFVKPIEKKCPKCGNNIKPGWKFCVFCSEVIHD